MRSRWVIACGLSWFAPAHAGGTFEAGIGGGAVVSRADGGDTSTRAALALPSMSGGVRRGDVAIVGRISMIHTAPSSLIFYGVGIQWWPNERWFLAGGLGGGQIQLDEPIGNVIGYLTLALDLRAGINLRPGKRHRATLSVELVPGIYRDEIATGAALQLGYQYW